MGGIPIRSLKIQIDLWRAAAIKADHNMAAARLVQCCKTIFIPKDWSYIMFKLVTDVHLGDTILEGGNHTKITKIEPCQSSKRSKTHINGKDCYENFSEIRMQD